MKKIVFSSLLSITLLLVVEFIYVQNTSTAHLIKLVTRAKRISHKSQKYSEKDFKEELIRNKQINVIEIKTGFYAGNLWYPSMIVKFKNNSKRDLKQYIKATAIFIDNSTNEQIGVHTKYLSTTNEIFLQGTSLRKQFKSNLGYRGGLTMNLKISVKLYLEDELIGTYAIKNQEI